jgi:hypothetical protein
MNRHERRAAKAQNRDAPNITMEFDKAACEMFLKLDGRPIAKRGHAGTPRAKQWIPLELGVVVRDGPDMKYIAVEKDGVAIRLPLQ